MTFKILSERDHILQRSGMWVGSSTAEQVTGIFCGKFQTLTIVPALMKIVHEILDNSVDEFVRTQGRYANRIDITISNSVLEGTTVTILDNGRGIPVEQLIQEGEVIGWKPTLAWTRARAGSNFSDDANRITMGMNGVGSFLTNVFSTFFEGMTCDGKKRMTVTCADNGILQSEQVADSNLNYTQVMFSPDFSKFSGVTLFDNDHMTYLRDRLENLCMCFPELEFRLNNVKIKHIPAKQIASSYFRDAVWHSTDNVSLVIGHTITPESEFHLLSYVNGLNVRNGGTHVEFLLGEIIENLRALIKKKYKIEVSPSGIKQHLTVLLHVRNFKNPKFDSQTKERLTNPISEVREQLSQLDTKKLAKQMLDSTEIITPIVEAILYKKELADRLALARQQKKLQKTRIVSHIQAQNSDPEATTLFITEGLSAVGQILSTRDPKTIGAYPLKGKVMNTHGMSASEIMKNKELSELMAILGLEWNKPCLQPNYGKIAIMSDADTDGGHIFCLLLQFFSNWPELFSQHRVTRCLTPLYIATKGTEVRHFYTRDEFENANLSKSWEVDYIKGLGSLPQSVYKQMITHPRLLTITLDDNDRAVLDMAFGESAEPRKNWLMEIPQ